MDTTLDLTSLDGLGPAGDPCKAMLSRKKAGGSWLIECALPDGHDEKSHVTVAGKRFVSVKL